MNLRRGDRVCASARPGPRCCRSADSRLGLATNFGRLASRSRRCKPAEGIREMPSFTVESRWTDQTQQGGGSGGGSGAMSEVLDPSTGKPDALGDIMGPRTAQDMTFDGQKLRLYEPELMSDAYTTRNRPLLAEWDAVAGRPGYQSSEYQSLRDTGPIPEGNWLAKQSRFQLRCDASPWDQFKGVFGAGTWKGGQMVWGDSRVWLEPMAGTNTFGRSNFSIHGGWFPGSAGCIDLTSSMPSFSQWFRSLGTDLTLRVQY